MVDRPAKLNEAEFDELQRLEIEGVIGGPASLIGRGTPNRGAEAADAASAAQTDDTDTAQAPEYPADHPLHPGRLAAGAAFVLAALGTMMHVVTPEPPVVYGLLASDALDAPAAFLSSGLSADTNFVSGSIEAQFAPLASISNIQPMKAAGPDCRVRVHGSSEAVAWISLEIDAPCDPDTRVEITEGPLRISLRTDGEGRAHTKMPALVAEPHFEVRVGDRAPVDFRSLGRETDRYVRTTLLWQGDAGLELHVFEDGAGYGDPGHVWAEAPGKIDHALAERGGFLTMLGDPDLPEARLAAVYTRPVEVTAEVSVEVPVTDANCGREISGRAILTGPDLLLGDLDLNMTMPACDAVGSIIVLGSPAGATLAMVATSEG